MLMNYFQNKKARIVLRLGGEKPPSLHW